MSILFRKMTKLHAWGMGLFTSDALWFCLKSVYGRGVELLWRAASEKLGRTSIVERLFLSKCRSACRRGISIAPRPPPYALPIFFPNPFLCTPLAVTAEQILHETSSQRQSTRECPLERWRRTAPYADPTRSREGYGGGGVPIRERGLRE